MLLHGTAAAGSAQRAQLTNSLMRRMVESPPDARLGGERLALLRMAHGASLALPYALAAGAAAAPRPAAQLQLDSSEEAPPVRMRGWIPAAAW